MVLINKNLLASLLRMSTNAITAVALWTDDVQKSQWKAREDVLKHYPKVKFLAGSMATFFLGTEDCSVTVQIAFNTGVVIVLAASANTKLSEVRH